MTEQLIKIARSLSLICDPPRLIRRIIKKLDTSSFSTRLAFDAFEYPQFAYGIYHAALQAKGLGIQSISAIEFGVAGGKGLLEMEMIASMIQNETGVKIEVYGFDIAEGLPEADDYRDLPYTWKKGFFKMDYTKLKAKLQKADLIIGDVNDTVIGFLEDYKPSPIGFISFDMDYYSSTMKAFKIFSGNTDNFLPRVFCFFDDCVGSDYELHTKFTGELLAIEDFNTANDKIKIGKLNGLKYKRLINYYWNESIYITHFFEHKNYNNFIYSNDDWQRPI